MGPKVVYKKEDYGLSCDVKVWTTDIEEEARLQLLKTARMPFVRKLSVMPDVHYGLGATIGSVVATTDAIMPASVGVDIGCGMLVVPLGIKKEDIDEKILDLKDAIEKTVPAGFNGHSGFAGAKKWRKIFEDKQYRNTLKRIDDLGLREKAETQLGTLGGGNHFIEIVYDENDDIWLMLHSGSRGVGNKLAEYHIKKAKSLIEEGAKLPDKNLASFTKGTKEFDEYIEDLVWAQDYARDNRLLMVDLIEKAIKKVVDITMDRDSLVHCHHNYMVEEIYDGEQFIVARKGAVRAGFGEMGIIPGSMGSKSYIVRGKGNREALESCSHGAGRSMSRSQAKKKFTVDDLIEQTKGIECRKDKGVLDEIPGSYKDIDEVMENQTDLVEVIHTLRQLICIKG